MPELSTRERVITEAMKLFGQNGFKGTKVTQIESAAGLSAGSGALYRYFPSKEAILEAGIDRQLDRRKAAQDIRALFAGLGDQRAELKILARYMIRILDDEAALLRIAAGTTIDQTGRLTTVCAALLDGLDTEMASWIRQWAPTITGPDSDAIAALAMNALLGNWTRKALLNTPHTRVSDDQYAEHWSAWLADWIDTHR